MSSSAVLFVSSFSSIIRSNYKIGQFNSIQKVQSVGLFRSDVYKWVDVDWERHTASRQQISWALQVFPPFSDIWQVDLTDTNVDDVSVASPVAAVALFIYFHDITLRLMKEFHRRIFTLRRQQRGVSAQFTQPHSAHFLLPAAHPPTPSPPHPLWTALQPTRARRFNKSGDAFHPNENL